MIGGMVGGLELARQHLQPGEPGRLRGWLALLAILAGVVLFAASSRLAARFTDEVDE